MRCHFITRQDWADPPGVYPQCWMSMMVYWPRMVFILRTFRYIPDIYRESAYFALMHFYGLLSSKSQEPWKQCQPSQNDFWEWFIILLVGIDWMTANCRKILEWNSWRLRRGSSVSRWPPGFEKAECGQHRNTRLMSPQLASVHHHGCVTQWKLR